MKVCNSFGNINEQCYIVVSDEIVTEVSPSFANMTKYSVDELVHKNITDVFDALKMGPNFHIENVDEQVDYFFFTKSLDVRFVNIGVMEDLQEKIYIFSEKPNSRLNIKFPSIEALCSHNVFGVAVFSAPDITLLKANQTYLNFLDKPYNNMENSIGKKIHQIIFGWVGSSSEDIWRNVLSTEKPFYGDEYMFEFERGITYWQASLTPVFENGILKYCIEITTDITEKVLNRKKIEEQAKVIEQQKRELETILDNMSDGVATIDKDGNYNKINKTLKQWLNDVNPKKAGDTLNIFKYFDIMGKELSKYDFPAVRVARGERIEHYELFVNDDGYQRYFTMSGTPIYDKNGSFIMGVFCIKDITKELERGKLINQQQELLLKAERERNEALEKAIEMKDEFLSLISHEFRTPLNVVNMAVQTLNLVYADQMTDSVKKYVGTIRQNANRQLRLVNNLLDITRVKAGSIKIHKKNIDMVFLTKAITESVYGFAAQKGVELTFVSSFEKKIIAIDDEKYERIILNLLSNAIKFTPEGRSIIVNLRLLKGKICVEVKDLGIGIPPDKLDVIFERFGQVDSSLSRQAEGTGIGLALVKKFTEALGGSISVKSKIGKGTTFTILLPDKTEIEDDNGKLLFDLMDDSRLVQTTNIEFSDIYL